MKRNIYIHNIYYTYNNDLVDNLFFLSELDIFTLPNTSSYTQGHVSLTVLDQVAEGGEVSEISTDSGEVGR